MTYLKNNLNKDGLNKASNNVLGEIPSSEESHIGLNTMISNRLFSMYKGNNKHI